MRFRFHHFLFILLFAGVVTPATAQEETEFEPYFQLETRRNGAARFDFKMYNNLVVIPVVVNGSRDTLQMVLDTGVARNLITGLPNGEEIYLNFTETIRIAGLGEGASIEAYYSKGNELIVDQSTGINQEVIVLAEDIFNLSALLGTYVHGLIGYHIFRDFIVEIDYNAKWIKLHDHERFGERYQKKKASRDWSAIPLTIRNNKPYVDVQVIQRNGTSRTLNLLIDSGASHALSLYHSASDSIYLPEKKIRSFLGNGLSGEIYGYWGRVDELMFGGHSFEEPVASFPDEEGIRRAIVYSSRDGSIGSEILKRFKVMYNYRDSSMIIQPSRYYDNFFSYNMTGMEVATPFPGIQLYEVTNIREGSLADSNGVKVGDYITEINSKPSTDYTLNEVIDLFNGTPGEELYLKFVRNDSTYRKRMVLQDELN